MKRKFSLPVLAAGLLLVSLVTAAEDAVIPAPEFVYCTVCHGIDLGGNVVIQAPRLSGMEPWYAKRQLIAFTHGWRGKHDEDQYGHEMRPMAAALTAKEINDVVNYIEAVESPPPPLTVEGNAERGKRLYGSCIACHGANAEGNEMLGGPGLTGLNDWYLLTQLRHFKAGIRGGAPDDASGQQMKAAAQVLADEQAMRDVVRYIATMGR